MRLLPARSLYHWARAVRRPCTVNACALVVADVPIVSAVSSTTIDPVAAAGNAREHPVIASPQLPAEVIPLLRKHSRGHFERHFAGDDEVFTASGRRLSALGRSELPTPGDNPTPAPALLTSSAVRPGSSAVPMKQQCGTSTPALLVGATSTAVGATPHCCRSDSALLIGATRTAGRSDPHCWFTAPALLSLRARTASDSDPRAGRSVSLAPSSDRRFPLAFSQESTVHGAVVLPMINDGYGIMDVIGVDHL